MNPVIQKISSFGEYHSFKKNLRCFLSYISYHTLIRKRLPYIGNVSSVDVMRVKMDGNGDSAFGSAGGDNEDALISSQPTPPPT